MRMVDGIFAGFKVTDREKPGEPTPVHVMPGVDVAKFPLAQKVELLMAELKQMVLDLQYLHRCTGNEYAEQRMHEVALRLEELEKL